MRMAPADATAPMPATHSEAEAKPTRQGKRTTRASRKAQAKARRKEEKQERRPSRAAGKKTAAASEPSTPAKPKPARKEKQPRPVSAQDTLPFAGIAADGTVMVSEGVYCRIVRFGDVDYKLARREDREAMFERWCEILNSFDASVGVDLACVNRRPDPGELAALGDVRPKGDALDPVRSDYAEMLAARAAAASGGLIKEHMLAFSVKAKDAREARSRLARVESKLSGDLHTLGVRSAALGRAEVIRTMARLCSSPVPRIADLDRRAMRARGLVPKDLIAPAEFDFGHADWYRCGRTLKRAGHLQINAPELSDEVLADLLGGDVPMSVAIHLDPMDPAAGKKLVNAKASDIDKMKIEEQKKAIRAGYDPDILPPELANFSEEARRLSREIEKENERLFDATVTVTVEGRDMRELRDAFFAADAIAQGHNCKLRPLKYLQEHAFAASLPLGVPRLPISRTLTTSAAAAFVPFTAAELRTGGEALYYGVNAITRNLIVADRKLLKNPNGLILGIPGGGKSFSAKGEIVAVILLTDDDVVICDPEGEYGPVVRACGGQVVKISATSPHHVNPMDINLDYSDDDNPLALKSDFVLSLVEVIMGGKTGLTAAEKSVVDRCLPKVYAGYLADPRPENMPVLGDLYECLLEQSEPEAAGIATALEDLRQRLAFRLQPPHRRGARQPRRVLRHQGPGQAAQEARHAGRPGPGLEPRHREPGGQALDALLRRRVPPAAPRRADGGLHGRDLEALPQVGRHPHGHHAEREGPARLSRDREHPRQLRLHHDALPGGRRPRDPRQTPRHIRPATQLRNQRRERLRASLLRRRHRAVREQVRAGDQALQPAHHQARGGGVMAGGARGARADGPPGAGDPPIRR